MVHIAGEGCSLFHLISHLQGGQEHACSQILLLHDAQ